MALSRCAFVFLWCVLGGADVPRDPEISAVLDRLNGAPFKVHSYREATLVNAQKKAGISELTLDVSVDCVNTYPDVPCSERVLTCTAYVGGAAGAPRVLNDVSCVAKPEAVVEEAPFVASTDPGDLEANEAKPIALSNEAASSEVGEQFVAVRRELLPCTGCPFDLNPDAKGVEELIEVALGHVETERDKKQTAVKVLRLQEQIESGIKYFLLVEIAPTVCPKDTPQEPCPLDTSSTSSVCLITYLQKAFLSKIKHIIANNCTTSQEFYKPEGKKTDLDNEIDGALPKPEKTVNFDRMAESGAIDEMTPSRLSLLESQILVEDDAVESTEEEIVAPSTVQEERTILNDFVGTFFAPSTERMTELPDDDVAKRSEESTESAVSQTPQGTNSSEESIEVSSIVLQVRPRPLHRVGVEDVDMSTRSAEGSESASNSSESDSGEEVKSRPPRAIPQLEKISAEEKPLVKNLADFAASALDNIDDDNHKRVVLQVLGAKKMTGDDGVYYHLIMRMGISRCLEDASPGDNCRDKLFENYTKICKVQVYVNDDFGSPKVVKSQCQNIKRDRNDSNRTNYSRFKRDVLVGAPVETDKDGDAIGQYVREGMAYLNSEKGQSQAYAPVEVLSATSQVVAGILYRIKVKTVATSCSNELVNLEQCSPSKVCDLNVWAKPWENFTRITVKCDGDDRTYEFEPSVRRSKRSEEDIGALDEEFEVSKDDVFVGKYLEGSLAELDAESSQNNKLKVHEVMSVDRQIVAGHIYRIKAKIVLSDCKKGSTKRRSKCGTFKGSKPRTCNFEIFEKLWLPNSRQTNVTCDDGVRMFRGRRDLNGLLGGENRLEHSKMFAEFVAKYRKNYDGEELRRRFHVFSDNVRRIRMLNALEQGTAVYGVTRFADLTQEEFSRSLGLRPELRGENETPFARARVPEVRLPTEFDWRKDGVVTEVKDQANCGSCWAFSVTGNVEGQYAIKHEKLLEFSEQELVDCDAEDKGCDGGLMDTAYRVIEKLGGLETERDYPYEAKDEKCHFNKTLTRVQLTGALNISQDETEMAKWLVANGPISIAINANAMQFYFGGVSHPFKFLCSPTSLDHGVLIVGYGVHTYSLFNKTLPYWIVKNSWGKSWGEQGYYRVYRGDGTCGVNQTPSSAIVA